MDPFQYGNSQAAINLVKILEEFGDRRYVRKVTSFLSNNNELIRSIMTVSNPQHRDRLLKLVRYNSVKNEMELPKIIRDHMLNVLAAKIKVNTSWNKKNKASGVEAKTCYGGK